MEQHAIGHLLDVLKGEGVTVLHLEHDGLVTDRVIPQVCIEYMIQHSLMPNYVNLETKAFNIETGDELDNLVKSISQRAVTTSNSNIRPDQGSRPYGPPSH
jgi:hypothetical protein